MMPARKIDYEESWDQIDYNEVLKTEEPKRLVRRKPKYSAAMFKVFLCMVIVVGVMVLLLQRYTVISETKYQIFNYKSEIKELNFRKEEMKAKLDSAFVIEYVEQVATEELNMQYPTASQVVYINGDAKYALKEEYFVVVDPDVQRAEVSYFDKFNILPEKLTKAFK